MTNVLVVTSQNAWSLSIVEDPGQTLIPCKLAADAFAVSTNAAVDFYQQPKRGFLAGAATQSIVNGDVLSRDADDIDLIWQTGTFNIQCDRTKIDALQFIDSDTLQMACGPGYQGLNSDVTNCRSEISNLFNLSEGVEYWNCYGVVRPDNLTHTDHSSLWQLHPTVDTGGAGPIFMLSLEDEGLKMVYRGQNTDPIIDPPVEHICWTLASFPQGSAAFFLRRLVVSPTGSGQLQVWWCQRGETSMTQVVNLTGIALGYPDPSGPYDKLGVYQAPKTVPWFQVRPFHYRIPQTGSLASLITAPPTFPAPFNTTGPAG